MAKVLALDIGVKRTGVAETDFMQIIASGLTTIMTQDLMKFLTDYISDENPDSLVIGEPRRMHGVHSDVEEFIKKKIKLISSKFPDLRIYRVDERFTSKLASQAISQSGMSKKKRQNKALIDEVSAVIILQTWLNRLS